MITIQNSDISLTVSPLGAQMMNICTSDGVEYLWQGDPAYWSSRSPILFPFVGRLTDNSYKYGGKTYPMTIHGFILAQEFRIAEQSDDSVTLEAESNDETLAIYPFSFLFRTQYKLCGNTIQITYTVVNRSDRMMPFGLGGHPGFRVPIVPEDRFENYYLEFDNPCEPDRIGFTPGVYLNGQDLPYPLTDGQRVPLVHSLFDNDALVFRNMDRGITLKSSSSSRGVHVDFPDFPYIGFWHKNCSDAPYVCIEPWTTLPSRQDIVEDFSYKSDMIRLAPGATYTNNWSIRIF